MIGRLLAGLLLAVALNTGALAVEAQTPGQPSDQAVIDDIEKTIRGLSDHISVGSKRVRVAGTARSGVLLPGRIDLTIGKSMNVDLPAEAHEVVVGSAEIVDVATVKSKRRLFIMGRKIGRSNVFVLDDASEVIAQVEIQVGVDGQSAAAAMKRALPDEPIEVGSEGASLVLSGKITSDAVAGRAVAIAKRFVEKDDQIVNLLRVTREQQVLLQARVAEVQRTALKEIGANSRMSGDAFGLGKLNVALDAYPQGISPSTAAAGALSFTGIKDLFLLLSFLETRGLVRNLAEPNLVAVSGEKASMVAGGEIPIPVAGKDGEVELEFKAFGVLLSFVPIVLDSGRISLKLSTEVSALSEEGFSVQTGGGNTLTIPSFTVRRASSTVELPDGGSLMIAGLIQNDMISGMSGIPGAMDIPILGRLFKSDQFKRNETELVIFISANLVKPTAPGSMTLPTDSVSPGGDLDVWLFGHMLGRYTPGFQQDRIRDKQPVTYGFTLDEVLP